MPNHTYLHVYSNFGLEITVRKQNAEEYNVKVTCMAVGMVGKGSLMWHMHKSLWHHKL
jgi:glutamine synthetase